MTGELIAAEYVAKKYFPLVPGTKEPAIKEWQNVEPGKYPPVGNYGLALDPGDLVIDVDPRNYPEGRDVLKELMNLHLLPPTLTVKTPSGGLHIYFKKPPSLEIRTKQELYPGIDFLSAGRYTVQPGSKLPNGVYTTIVNEETAELPASLSATLERVAQRIETGAEVSLAQYEKFKIYCETAVPAIEGKNGDNTTYKMGCAGRDLGLPKETVYQLMRDHWNPRCLPPWDEKELFEKVGNSYRHAKNALGCDTPEAKFLAEHANSNVVSMKSYQNELVMSGIVPLHPQVDKNNRLVNTISNIVYILRNDSAWRGRLKYNQFAGCLEFDERPDWRKNQKNIGKEITRRDEACMKAWFSASPHIKLEVSDVDLVTSMQAAAIPYHPVLEYLEKLQWDGVQRLDKILIDTAGAADTSYHRAVGAKTIIAAVKRIYEPGCKHDHVLILESKQGKKKSTWIAELGGEWYSASELVRGDKDTYQNLRGRWFVELPEINATFTKADFAWLKGIISNPIDVYRSSYARNAAAVPRESIFIGSINPNASGQYLKDEENRRYWPVRVSTHKDFDIELLKQNRDQYFAEAVHRYKIGEAIWLDQIEIAQEAMRQQDDRREDDPWVDLLFSWVSTKTIIDPREMYIALGLDVSRITSSHRARIYGALRTLGFEFRRTTAGNGLWFSTKWGGLL